MSDAPAAPTLGERAKAIADRVAPARDNGCCHDEHVENAVAYQAALEALESQSAEIARQAAQLKAAEYSAKTWERAAEQADEREAAANARNARLTEALREILPSPLCGESWDLPDTEHVSIDVTFGKLKRARQTLLDAQPEQGVE